MKTSFCLLLLLMVSGNAFAASACGGRFPNPVTDTCWGCMFPIALAGSAPISSNQWSNHDSPPPTVCTCPAPPPLLKRPGIGLSIWEAWRIIEVVRSPGCFPTLNAMNVPMLGAEGTSTSEPEERSSFAYYHVHMMTYPIVSQVYGAIVDTLCFQSTMAAFNMLYVTEIDPLWADDDLAGIFSPEAFLFNNPITQATCIADSVSATVTNFGLDPLYWCSGSQGSVFPLSASSSVHIGGIDSSLNKAHSFLFKLQRHALIKDTSSPAAMCLPIPMVPFLRKNQFKQQALYPVAQPLSGIGLGKASQYWSTGFEFPVKGEDFSYLFWRKRTCCAL